MIKLLRINRYTVQTYQEIDVTEEELLKLNLEEAFYDCSEDVMVDGNEVNFQHMDNLDFLGHRTYIQTDDKSLEIERYENELKDDMLGLEDWDKFERTTIKEYIRGEKINKIIDDK